VGRVPRAGGDVGRGTGRAIDGVARRVAAVTTTATTIGEDAPVS
jgi:hypothetical protein